MICEVRGVFPTVPNNARSVRGRQRAAAGGTGSRAHPHTLTHTPGSTLDPGSSGGEQALSPHALRGIPTHTHIHGFFCPEKSVNKASMAPNEAFLSDFFGSIKQTVASFD